jgi:DNA-binding transcriptional LysR family regulator
MPDLNQMVVFAAVVREGSFSAAARLLGQPKSTVSKRLAQLESRLGVRLLHRSTRSVRLTDEGAAYYERCRRVVADAEEADRALADRDDTPRGRVRISASDALGQWLAPVVHRFLHDHPRVSVELSLTDARVDVIGEGFDLAIRAGPLRDTALVARRLGSTSALLCASPAYLDAHPAPSVPLELAQHACIVAPGRAVWTFERDGERVVVPVAGRYAVGSMRLAHGGALAGLGIARVARVIAEPDLAAGRLRQVLADWPLERGHVHVLYANPRPAARVRAFVALLAEAYAR